MARICDPLIMGKFEEFAFYNIPGGRVLRLVLVCLLLAMIFGLLYVVLVLPPMPILVAPGGQGFVDKNGAPVSEDLYRQSLLLDRAMTIIFATVLGLVVASRIAHVLKKKTTRESPPPE
jgi:hypothetical protein